MTTLASLGSNLDNRPGLFRPRRMGHVNFWTKNYLEVAEFYRSVVGIEEAYHRPTVQAMFMSNGNTYHDFAFVDVDSPRAAGRSAGLHHISFELENERDLVEGFKRAREAGFEFGVTLSADVTRSAYGDDPDGNRFEVYADVKPDWRSQRQGEVHGENVKWVPGAVEPQDQSFYPVDPEIKILSDAVFHPVRVSHAVLVAKDFAEMYRHYTELVGLHPLVGGKDAQFAVLGGALAEESLTLFRTEGRRPPGLHHVGIELPDEAELLAAKQRLHARGLVAEFAIDHATRTSLYLRDPNNQLIQFYVNRSVDYAAWGNLPEELALFVA